MRQLATIQKIEEIKSIPTADAIVAAKIKGWWVVVHKDEFNIGDKVIYYEVDSFLPVIPEYEFLMKGNNPKKMIVDGREVEGIRLKTIKLRGQLSQGLIMPLSSFKLLEGLEAGEDVSDLLGVLKYEPPIPACMSGKIKGGFPGFLRKTDEERIQNMEEVLYGFYMTEKLDGTSATYYKKDGTFGVCSKNIELQDGENVYWEMAKTLDLMNKIPDYFCLQGEIVGEGIQGNPLKLNGRDIYFFSAYNIVSGVYLDFDDFIKICNTFGLKTVPVIDDNFNLPKNLDEMLSSAEGKSKLNLNVEREGVVVRSKTEMDYRGQRFSFKAISNKYLLNEK
jgi:RNA ligase (TIGR02306 family)